MTDWSVIIKFFGNKEGNPLATTEKIETRQEFDLFRPLRSSGALENPAAIYGLLRTVQPVLEMPVDGWDGPGIWFLTGHAEVNSALRDNRLSVDRLRAPLIQENLDRLPAFIQQSTEGVVSMLTMDAPDHTRVRKLVNKAFTPRRIEKLRGHVKIIVDELLAPMSSPGEMDVIEDLAAPLPAIVIAELLGVPAEDHRMFKTWASEAVASFGNNNLGDLESRDTSGIESLLAYLAGIIAQRRKEPRDDLISAMILAQEESDALTDRELLATSNLILIAGHETTTNLIGNGLLALLREPTEMARLRANPDLLPTAVEELLRFDGPVQATVRVATEDLEIGGQEIAEGSLILVSIGAANHDPMVFTEPERLDLGRDPNPHLGFGFGAHFCLGAGLARLEGSIALQALVERFPHMSLATEHPKYRPNPILRGLEALPVKF